MNCVKNDCLKFLYLCSPKLHPSCVTEMLHRFKLSILLKGLTLLLFGPACEASSLGLAVYAVPLDSNGGKTVSKTNFFCLVSILTFLQIIEVVVCKAVN